jgi:hypothetical protein
MHDMHHMAVAQWTGIALAIPSFLIVVRASWREHQRSHRRTIDHS